MGIATGSAASRRASALPLAFARWSFATWSFALRALLAIAGGVLLSACSTTAGPPATATLPPGAPVITVDDLIGSWGLGAFRNEADLARTAAEARRYCSSNPYAITKGPNGGAMMYLADQTQPTELVVKTASGRVYIGPPGPAGTVKDRQVTSFANGVLVAAWVDPTIAARYGTLVFVKCDSSAPKPAATATAAPTPAPTTQAPSPK